jgi:hypothetical protein
MMPTLIRGKSAGAGGCAKLFLAETRVVKAKKKVNFAKTAKLAKRKLILERWDIRRSHGTNKVRNLDAESLGAYPPHLGSRLCIMNEFGRQRKQWQNLNM